MEGPCNKRGRLGSSLVASVFGLTCLLGVLAAPSPAKADLLTFSYNDGTGPAISGVFDGTLSGNYFTVTALDSLSVDGTAYPLTADLLESADTLDGWGQGYDGNGSAVVTLDGSYIDIIVSPDNGATGFAFAVNDLSAAAVGANLYAFNLGGSAGDDPFVAADWSASVTTAPEPMTAALFAVALPGLALVRKRRSKVDARAA